MNRLSMTQNKTLQKDSLRHVLTPPVQVEKFHGQYVGRFIRIEYRFNIVKKKKRHLLWSRFSEIMDFSNRNFHFH